MHTSLSTALKHISEFEGGYVNHPRDPGGCTNRGITLATYRRFIDKHANCAKLRGMSWGQAAEIYRAGYWAELACDALPAGLDLVVFDMGVNAGPARSARLLQRLVGADPDGVIGPETLTAVARHAPRDLIGQFTARRIAYYQSLDTWETFGKGWTRRAEAARSRALELAEAQKKSPRHPL